MKFRTNQNGFTALEVILVIIVIGLIGGSSWIFFKVQRDNNYQSQQSSQQSEESSEIQSKSDAQTTPAAASKIRFEDDASFSASNKQEILSRYAEPLLLYTEQVLKIEVKEVVIKKNANMMNSSDARYILDYVYKDNPLNNKFGFIFGYNSKFEYWQPQLCDNGGCKEYPSILKDKFPKSYDAYVACKAANDEGDKDKASSLGCMIF